MPLIQTVIECEHPGGEIVAESAAYYWIRCSNCGDLLKLNREGATKHKRIVRGVTEHRYSKRILDEVKDPPDGA